MKINWYGLRWKLRKDGYSTIEKHFKEKAHDVYDYDGLSFIFCLIEERIKAEHKDQRS